MTTKRALVCAPLMPEFDRESGSKRIFDFVEFLRDAGWAVSYVAENGAPGARYASILRQRGVATYSGFDERFAELVAFGRFDVAILAFWYTGETCLPLIRELSPATRVIVDTVDLHFLRNARRVFLPSGERGEPGALNADDAALMIREINTYVAADAVLAVSPKEAALVNDLVGAPGLAHAVPDAEELPRSAVPFADRAGVAFIGNFRHPPNIQAAEYLLHKIVPRLRFSVLAAHPIYVVGNGLDGKAGSLGLLRPGVRTVGWVPSVIPYLERCRVSVVPLLHGAGTKRKMIQALMVGTPTVSTSVGVEGLNLRDGEHVVVADDSAAFADAMTRLLSDQPLWQRIADQGREHILATHGRQVARARFLDVLAALLDDATNETRAKPYRLGSRAWPTSLAGHHRSPNGRARSAEPRVFAARAGAFLVATPNPVPHGPGLGTTTLIWSTGNDELGLVRVSEDGKPETPFADGATGSQEAPWLRSGHRYEFRLYSSGHQEVPLAAVSVMRPWLGFRDTESA